MECGVSQDSRAHVQTTHIQTHTHTHTRTHKHTHTHTHIQTHRHTDRPGAERSSEPAAADVATLVLPGGVLAAVHPLGLREDGRPLSQLGTAAVGTRDPAGGAVTLATALLPPLTLVIALRVVLQQEVGLDALLGMV